MILSSKTLLHSFAPSLEKCLILSGPVHLAARTLLRSATWSKQEKEYRHLIHNVDFAIRMNPKNTYHLHYYAEEVCGSPRHIPVKNFNTPIGSTANEALEFVYELMERYIDLYGSPDNDTHYQTTRYDKLNEFDPAKLFNTLIQETDWDQGKKSILLYTEDKSHFLKKETATGCRNAESYFRGRSLPGVSEIVRSPFSGG